MAIPEDHAAPSSLRPSVAEGALLVVLAAVVVLALVPNVVVAPYADPLAEASEEALRRHVADEALPVAVRLRAAQQVAERAGEAVAVEAVLAAVSRASVARSEPGEALLTWVAQRPAPAAAGAVLEAWLEGRLPDAIWREQFLPAGWADAAAWTAVPLVWASEPDRDETQLIWIADVLGHAGEQRIAVPRSHDTDATEAPPLRYRTSAEVLLDYVRAYLVETPPRRMRPELELRLFENLARTPRYLAAEAESLAEDVVASQRLPDSAQDAQLRNRYARAVLDLAEATKSAQDYAAWLEALSADESQANAYGPHAAVRLR